MSATSDSPLILGFEDARHTVEEHAASVRAPGTEMVDLLDSDGRVLAEAITADRDIPPFRRATRDGYAVRSADFSETPRQLDVIGEIKAGLDECNIPAAVGSGQAVSIMTGAPVPPGADAVVMVEYTSRRGNRVEVTKSVGPGENVVPLGAEAKQESLLIGRGTRLDERAIALAASVGRSRLEVYSQPRVAVLTTGDEIVAIDTVPGPTQIRNSNSYSLATQIRGAGVQPILLPIAPDVPHQLKILIQEGLRCDLLLMTGGVSMGRYDLVEQVLSELDAEFFFTGAKIQPGRPVVFGRCNPEPNGSESPAKYFFGLPGNPVSTMVTFELFVRPMLDALAGQSAQPLQFLHARLKTEIRVKTGLTRFLPANLGGEFEHIEVELVAWQGSGDIAATARANCYVVVPPDRDCIGAGEWISLLMR